MCSLLVLTPAPGRIQEQCLQECLPPAGYRNVSPRQRARGCFCYFKMLFGSNNNSWWSFLTKMKKGKSRYRETSGVSLFIFMMYNISRSYAVSLQMWYRDFLACLYGAGKSNNTPSQFWCATRIVSTSACSVGGATARMEMSAHNAAAPGCKVSLPRRWPVEGLLCDAGMRTISLYPCWILGKLFCLKAARISFLKRTNVTKITAYTNSHAQHWVTCLWAAKINAPTFLFHLFLLPSLPSLTLSLNFFNPPAKKSILHSFASNFGSFSCFYSI